MAKLLFANNATTTLAGPLSPTSTTCNVAAGTGVIFPQPQAGQYFKMTFLDAQTKTLREIVHVTAVSTDSFTIVRAQEGTSGQNWNTSDLAANLVTAGTFGAFAQTGDIATGVVSGTDTGTANAANVQAFVPTLPGSSPSPGTLLLITKASAGNTGAMTITLGTAGPIALVYGDGKALQAGDWPGTSDALVVYIGAVAQFLGAQKRIDATNILNQSGSASQFNEQVTVFTRTRAPGVAATAMNNGWNQWVLNMTDLQRNQIAGAALSGSNDGSFALPAGTFRITGRGAINNAGGHFVAVSRAPASTVTNADIVCRGETCDSFTNVATGLTQTQIIASGTTNTSICSARFTLASTTTLYLLSFKAQDNSGPAFLGDNSINQSQPLQDASVEIYQEIGVQ